MILKTIKITIKKIILCGLSIFCFIGPSFEHIYAVKMNIPGLGEVDLDDPAIQRMGRDFATGMDNIGRDIARSLNSRRDGIKARRAQLENDLRLVRSDTERLEIRRQIGACDEQLRKLQNQAAGIEEEFGRAGLRILTSPLDFLKAEQEAKNKRYEVAIQAEANKEAAIAKTKAIIESVESFIKEPAKLRLLIAATTGIACGIYGTWVDFSVLRKYLEKQIDNPPTLIKETSRQSLKERLYNSLFGVKRLPCRIKDVIVEPGLDEQLQEIAEATKKSLMSGDELLNVLFYGPPGTGKTMFAKALAQYSGLEYAIFSGADFSQFHNGEDIVELHKIFDWSENSKKGLLVFIDEADSFLASRSLATTTEKSKNLTNAFLSRVEKPSSNKIMFVFATNYPEALDDAVFTRVGPKVEFNLPALPERIKILDLYLGKYAKTKRMAIDKDVSDNVESVAKQLEGFSGRDIEEVVVEIVRAVRLSGKRKLSMTIVDKIVERKVKELEKQKARKEKYHIPSLTEAAAAA